MHLCRTRVRRIRGTFTDHIQGIIQAQTQWKVIWQLLQECRMELGFKPFLAEANTFMRKCPTTDCYEYVATYIDDLCIIMKDPQSILNQLKSAQCNFKLKGSGELAVYLSCGLFRDSTGILYMEDSYKRYFKVKPDQNHRSPLQKGDYPEIDMSTF